MMTLILWEANSVGIPKAFHFVTFGMCLSMLSDPINAILKREVTFDVSRREQSHCAAFLGGNL